jgi:hypothetical protein
VPADSIGYTPSVGQAPVFGFKDNIDMGSGMVADLQEFDKKNKEVDNKRRMARTNTTMQNATNHLNESTAGGDARSTVTNELDVSMVPAAKRA